MTSIRLYFGVFLALLALTALTTWIAFFDLGPWNNLLAMGIAATKASLVVLVFMHVRWSSTLTRLLVVSGLLWLAILIGLTLTDYTTRSFLSPPPAGESLVSYQGD